MSSPIRILISDDHPMVREGLEAMLTSEEGFDVVGLAKDGEEAFKMAQELKPDIILSDVRMPRMDGLTLMQKVHEAMPNIKVLLLAGMPLKEEEYRAKRDGGAGYLPKDVDQDKLSEAIRNVVSQSDYFASEFYQAAPSRLTAREMDVLRLVAQGNQREQIAAALGIGSESVKSHLKGIMTKLESPNATSAVSRAYELGILRA